MTLDDIIAAIADLPAESDLYGRAAFLERLDTTIRRYGVCVATQAQRGSRESCDGVSDEWAS